MSTNVVEFPRLREIPAGHVSGPDLAAAADISYRQLDYWTRTGYLTATQGAPGSGFPRVYPSDQVVLARLVSRLLDAGLQPKAAFALAHQLLDHGHAVLAGIRIELPQDL